MSISFEVPGYQEYTIKNIVFDLNGTLTVNAELRATTKELLMQLSKKVSLYVLTADTHNSLSAIQQSIGNYAVVKAVDGEHTAVAKRNFIKELGLGCTAALGNGANDVDMLEEAALAIAVLDGEGCYAGLPVKADILVRSIDDALKMLLEPRFIIATLRR